MRIPDFIKLIFGGLLSVVSLSGNLSAQTGLNYLEHRTFTAAEGSNNESLLAVRNPFNDQLISRIQFSVNNSLALDLSLGSDPEPFSMTLTGVDTTAFYTIFRLHNGSDLSEEFNFSLSIPDNQWRNVGFQFAPNYFAVEDRLDTSAILYAGSSQIIHNTSTNKYLTCLLEFNMDGTLQGQRLISHGPGMTRSITTDSDKFFGLMNENVQCMDFSFRDSIAVTENGVTNLMYSADWATYLDVRYSDGEGYSGILDYSGKLERRDAIVIGSNVYRVFEISGSADLDPTNAVANYTTPFDESHLVLARYNSLGNVEWIKLIARNQCEVSDPGLFSCTLLYDDDKLILDFFYTRSTSSSQYPSTFSVLNNYQILESGELLVNGLYKMSPGYVYILDSNSGNAIQIYSTNSVNSGFTQYRGGEKRVSVLEPGKMIFQLKSSIFTTDGFVVKSLYPEEMVYETELEPSTTLYSEFFVFPTSGSVLEDYFILGFEQGANGGSLAAQAFATLNDGRYLISGAVYKSIEMIFSNVPPVAVAAYPDPLWDRDALAIFAEKAPLQVRNQSESLFKLYPNPSSKFITIQSELPNATFRIFNQVGKAIQSGSLINTLHRIDITTLASGMYLLQIESKDGHTEGLKFVKQ